MKISLSSLVVATTDQLSSELGGEAVILHMGRGVYFGLDEVGTRIWGLVQTRKRVSDLCAALQSEYDVEAQRCQDAVLTLLAEMSDAGLIEVTDESAA
jgi:hypothetical protein